MSTELREEEKMQRCTVFLNVYGMWGFDFYSEEALRFSIFFSFE